MSEPIERPDRRKPRVFILEDSPLIALDLAMQAEDFGCEVVGPEHALSPQVQSVADTADVDVAILDLSLTNGDSDDIIRRFHGRGVPVIISSGYMSALLREQYPHAEVLGKPLKGDDLHAALSKLLAAAMITSKEA